MSRSGFRVGRIFGIDIRLDWSWLLILLLVVWNLSATFSSIHPNWSAVLVWGTAIVAALLFFGSVLAHELAHSVVAKARGIPVQSITLFLFGGVSNIQREPKSPGDEFVMAILGPITSLVLGGVLLAIAFISSGVQVTLSNTTQTLKQMGPLLTMVVWLGSINVTLGIFNLIPGFPLDGGRVLRSILWGATNNLRLATRRAAGVGQAIAWLMIIAGIAMTFGAQIPFFGTGLGGGLWLAFIGWFLNSASTQSYQQVVIHDVLDGVPVSRMMRLNPPTCSSDCTVNRLVHDHIMGTDDQAFPILEGGGLVGLVTLEDVRKVNHDAWDSTSIRNIMTPVEKLIVVSPDEDAGQALEKLASSEVRQLPVLSNGELVGMLRRRDIIKWLQLHAELAKK
jgi:Zn-dependent protease/predicted transcriptional regulator